MSRALSKLSDSTDFVKLVNQKKSLSDLITLANRKRDKMSRLTHNLNKNKFRIRKSVQNLLQGEVRDN